MVHQVGPFELVAAIGKGAMGQVWKARHRSDQAEVAIKFLTFSRDEWALEAFRNEVRAAAGLAHPGIVRVLDHGVVSSSDSVAVEGDFEQGCPYLVMELIQGQPLYREVGRLSWDRLSDLLLQLLDALAHSHARGVVHRDLKPGNVLLTWRDGLRAMLTDFGLSHAVNSSSLASKVIAGTPAYMAPEQFEGRFRDQGPWTDLYSLGCLAWALTCRTPPFGRGKPFEELRQAHLSEIPPALTPVIAVPAGLESWLRRLLAKREHQRFQRAADAAWGLVRLGGEVVGPDYQAVPLEDLPTHHLAGMHTIPEALTLPSRALQSLSLPMSALPSVDGGLLGAQPPDKVEGAMAVEPVPMPASWRRPAEPTTPPRLLGVGLNLYELRMIPLVGRERERDALWEALRQVHDAKRPQAVVLKGPSGCGKTRLARWVGERADETGSALFLAATSTTEGGPGTGLNGMLGRSFRCGGLKRKALGKRLHAICERGGLDTALVDSLSELILPAEEPERRHGTSVLFSGPAQKHALFSSVLEWMTTGRTPVRPAVLLVDDAQWGEDALDFVVRVLEEDRVPVLFLLIVQDEALAERPLEQESLANLQQHTSVRTVEIGPLSKEQHRLLVRELLGMEGELVERVARRTAGNPFFAEQLIGDWVARGILHPGMTGFRLEAGATVDLPADMLTAWKERIERILGEYSTRDARSLELAAVLGLDVDMREWRVACLCAGLTPSVELQGRLFQESLAHPDPIDESWSFGHAMVRETLVRRARDNRRLARHHRACSRMLDRIAPGEQLERLGRHQLLAGQGDLAMDTLAIAARRLERRGEQAGALRLWDYRERAMKVLGPKAADSRWGEGWLGKAEAVRSLGDHEQHAELTERLLKEATRHGWARLRCEALRNKARSLMRSSHIDDARSLLEEAIVLALRMRDEEALGGCRGQLATVYYRKGRYQSARVMLTRAKGNFERIDDEPGVANCLMDLARLQLYDGSVEKGLELVDQALEIYGSLGATWLLADARVIRGELLRSRGDLEEAERAYGLAAAMMASSGHPGKAIPLANLGLVQLARGQYEAARSTLEGLFEDIRGGLTPMIAASLHIALLCCCAAQKDAVAFDRNYSAASRILGETGFVDVENARLAESAGALALEQGWRRRADRAWSLALEQWRALGRNDEVRAIQAQLSQMNR